MQFNKYTHTHTHKNCRRDKALLFRTRHHLCRQTVALAGTRQLRSRGQGPVHTHRTEGVSRSEGRERANGVGCGIGVGGGNGDGHEIGGADGDGDRAGAETGVEANEGAQNGNEDGSGDGAGTERRQEWRSVDEHRIGTGRERGWKREQ